MTETRTEIDLDLQIACDEKHLPNEEAFIQWIALALEEDYTDELAEITIRIVESSESQALNLEYRGKDKPTNVLSFPFEAPPGVPINLLGDLVICKEVMEREASEQNKEVAHHWAHLCIHGCLHLLGYDHIEDDEAQIMESLEIKLLDRLGIANPYE